MIKTENYGKITENSLKNLCLGTHIESTIIQKLVKSCCFNRADMCHVHCTVLCKRDAMNHSHSER